MIDVLATAAERAWMAEETYIVITPIHGAGGTSLIRLIAIPPAYA